MEPTRSRDPRITAFHAGAKPAEAHPRPLGVTPEAAAPPYDPCYAHVTCPKCCRQFQRIDYRCAAHQLGCGYPLPPQMEPEPEHSLTEAGWQAFDILHGIY